MIWFELIWFDAIFGHSDLIWFDSFFKTTWFDLIWRLFKILWFDLTPYCHDLIWFDRKFQNHYRYIFQFKSSVQAKPMAPIERARWELSIGAIFVYETLISPFLWLGFGCTRNSDLKSKSNHDLIWSDLIWFEPDFSPHDLIWFDDSQKIDDLIWFDLKTYCCCVDLIWFDLNLPTPAYTRIHPQIHRPYTPIYTHRFPT